MLPVDAVAASSITMLKFPSTKRAEVTLVPPFTDLLWGSNSSSGAPEVIMRTTSPAFAGNVYV